MSNVFDGKLVLGFIADVLYIKGLICFDELDAIYNVKTASDLEVIVEKLLRGEFNAYKKGETYGTTV